MLHQYILDCIFHYIPHKLNFSINRLHINKALSRGKNNKLYVKSTKQALLARLKWTIKQWLFRVAEKQRQEYLVTSFNTMQTKQLVFSKEKNAYLQPTKLVNGFYMCKRNISLKQLLHMAYVIHIDPYYSKRVLA